jgi:plastocyanin
MRRVALVLIAVSWSAAATSAEDRVEVRGLVRANGRPQPHAVVWLDASSAPASAPSTAPVLDQRNLSFIPHVLAVRVGTTVSFPNNDRVFHNVFSFRDGKPFDLGMYPIGTTRQVKFDRPGLSRLFCNIHPNMAAYVMTVDTPYFAVADAQGVFRIRAVPPATYSYRAWRPGGRVATGTFSADGDRELEIEVP